MAEINFYINNRERKLLFEFFKEQDIYLVPDKKYPNENYEFVSESNEFIDTIENETVGFFAISKQYSLYGLYVERNEFFTHEESYFVKQRYGGPYIDIALYRGYADNADIMYKRTNLSYYPKYIKLQEEWEEFKVSDEFLICFKKTVNFLKSMCQKVKVNEKNYWISKDVCNELDIFKNCI